MNKEENSVLSGNKLIAKFMNTTYKQKKDTYGVVLYEVSWDWLMPVVEKIESLGYPIKITSKYCSVARDHTYKEPLVVSEFRDTKIKKVYDIVVEFIKWYNERNNNKN